MQRGERARHPAADQRGQLECVQGRQHSARQVPSVRRHRPRDRLTHARGDVVRPLSDSRRHHQYCERGGRVDDARHSVPMGLLGPTMDLQHLDQRHEPESDLRVRHHLERRVANPVPLRFEVVLTQAPL